MTTRSMVWRRKSCLMMGRIAVALAMIACAVPLILIPAGRGPSGPFLAAQPPLGGPLPELTGGGDWINTKKPITLKMLRGKFVLIDFWTLCCINCMQTLPDIEKLEAKYAKQLVVIGIHSPKFENERSINSVRQAVMRYEVTHPVLNDPDRNLWKAFAVQGWPTLILIDPQGNVVHRIVLERPKIYDLFDQLIRDGVRIHRAKKTLNEDLLPFQLAQAEAKTGPLYFPGKILVDERGSRIFIADSTHHRVVVTDMSGKHLETIGRGTPGKSEGSFARAQFDDPQGLALRDNVLFIADRKNHVVRAANLKTKTVKTVAGVGRRIYEALVNGPALRTGLNSPWALTLCDKKLFIANAGTNQIRVLDLARENLQTFAGTSNEDIVDGPRFQCFLAQPSGITSNGTDLFWADSETSSIRTTPVDGKGPVRTIIGKGLFIYGDQDGGPNQARLQHPLDVVHVDGKLYVADTYNSKIKEIELGLNTCTTLPLKPEDATETGPLFDNPGGLAYAAGKLYVADTNAHRIRIVDLKTNKVSTLALKGVEPPKKAD